MNKLDVLAAMVSDLKPDILGITESWATDSILDCELQLAGYQMFRCDRPSEHRGGGVLLYVRCSLQPIELHTKSQYGEHVWCHIGDLLVGVFYRSTNDAVVGGDNVLKLHQVLQEMSNRNVLIMGDFNYAEIDWSRHTVSTSALSGCRKFFRVV